MADYPSLHTKRLLLRPFKIDDAPTVHKFAGDKAVAATTLNVPHPYEPGTAEGWIQTHPERYTRGLGVVFAIMLQANNALMGSISLAFNQPNRRAEMGYWIGQPYWNQGYCTEAALAVIDYGFAQHNLNRIYARHMGRNPASGRVMQKIGMKFEGQLRQQIQKWGEFDDILIYGILRETFERRHKAVPDSE
jgi:RimJ/RimL family protein N-acetyltransferase